MGTQQCPLLAVLYQGGNWQRIADTGRVILLYLSNTIGNAVPTDTISGIIDAALRQVLRKFAIDPDKIAIAGTCGSGGQSFFWGRSNLNVFNRVVVVSPASAFTVTTPPQTKRAETYIIAGPVEESYYLQNSLRFAQALRHDGLRVKEVLALRAHGDRWEDYKFVGRWLRDSWADPNRADITPRFAANSLPVLTAEAVDQLAAFWSKFMAEPDSIQHTARVAHLRELIVPVGNGQRTVLMSDLSALARQYPSVASDLNAAGLTAQQEEAYRVALISARATIQGGDLVGPVPAVSALGKNIAFFNANPDKLASLDAAHMRTTP